MAALAINSLLGNQTGNLANHNIGLASKKLSKSSDDPVINRKHYSASAGGHQHQYQEYSGHQHSGGGGGVYYSKKKSRSVALSALTLLAFLFFLHILQQCLQDQMNEMNPQVVIMQARIKAPRESEAKEADKRMDQVTTEKPTIASSRIEKPPTAPPFRRSDNEYQYEKMQVPVKLRPTVSNGRH